MSKKDAAVYLRAAQLAEQYIADESHNNIRSCWLIDEICRETQSEARKKFVEHVLCGVSNSSALYGPTCSDNISNEARVIALCFAAAMAESGDL